MEELYEEEPHLREKGKKEKKERKKKDEEKEKKILSGTSKPLTASTEEDKLKEKYLKKFTNFEVIKKSMKISLKNWKYNVYTQTNSIANQFFSVAQPKYHAAIVDSITKDKNADALYAAFKAYIYFMVFKLVFSELMQLLAYFFIHDSLYGFRNVVLENISEKDVEFFDLFKTGEVIERIKNSEGCIENNFLFKTINFLMLIAKFVFVAGYLLSYSKSLTITYIIVFISKFTIDYVLTKYTEFRNHKKRMQNREVYSNYLTEFISNIRLVKSFSTEKTEVKRLQDLKYKTMPPFGGIENFLFKLAEFVHKGSEIVILFIAGLKTISGEMSFGDIMVFQSYSGQMRSNFKQIQNSFNDYWQLFENWRRFLEVYYYEPKIISRKNLKLEEVKGEIVFKNVTFAYPLKPEVMILKELSFDIKPGKVVAIVGHSGSGKTTISSLVQRFYDPISGEISIDGIDIRDFDLSWLHQQIGFVAQEPTLYSGSIKDNITYGVSEYTQEEFDKVCGLANVDKFVNNESLFPKGYDTLVGERGTKVSGGQKQRIAIARALMKNAKFLLFDEATSALDAESENDVQSAIDNVIKIKKITTIIIAHRLCTVKNADKILFLSDGKIIEQGTHKELIELDGEYKKLVQRQLVQ